MFSFKRMKNLNDTIDFQCSFWKAKFKVKSTNFSGILMFFSSKGQVLQNQLFFLHFYCKLIETRDSRSCSFKRSGLVSLKMFY